MAFNERYLFIRPNLYNKPFPDSEIIFCHHLSLFYQNKSGVLKHTKEIGGKQPQPSHLCPLTGHLQ